MRWSDFNEAAGLATSWGRAIEPDPRVCFVLMGRAPKEGSEQPPTLLATGMRWRPRWAR